jgi:hypothetical protein
MIAWRTFELIFPCGANMGDLRSDENEGKLVGQARNRDEHFWGPRSIIWTLIREPVKNSLISKVRGQMTFLSMDFAGQDLWGLADTAAILQQRANVMQKSYVQISPRWGILVPEVIWILAYFGIYQYLLSRA